MFRETRGRKGGERKKERERKKENYSKVTKKMTKGPGDSKSGCSCGSSGKGQNINGDSEETEQFPGLLVFRIFRTFR